MALFKAFKEKSRQLYDSLMAAQVAHARWECETSKEILAKRKKLLILMLLPILILSVAMGVAGASELPEVLGGSKKAYLPAVISLQAFFASLLIGLIAGLITGCIGAGGGFIITPALMSAGIRGILAVGTDMFHIFAKAIMGTAVHKKLGNVNIGLAIVFVVGSFAGVTCGAKINRGLYLKNPVLSDTFISLVYVLMLGFLGFYALYDFLKLGKKDNASGETGEKSDASQASAHATTGFALKLQSLHLPPVIKFDEEMVPGGRKISFLPVVFCGFVVGFVASIMGVGGGFLTFPMYVYGLGVSSFTTVGTDILQIIFTAGYASVVQYALYGYVFYTLAMGLLLGSLVGIQVGALTTKVVEGRYIRGFYATAIIAGFLNRLFTLPSKLSSMDVISISKSAGQVCDLIGIVLFFGIVGVFAVWVAVKFFTNLAKLREV